MKSLTPKIMKNEMKHETDIFKIMKNENPYEMKKMKENEKMT